MGKINEKEKNVIYLNEIKTERFPPIQNKLHNLMVYVVNITKNFPKEIRGFCGDDLCKVMLETLKFFIKGYHTVEKEEKLKHLLLAKENFYVIEEEIKILSSLKSISLKQEAYIASELMLIRYQLESFIKKINERNS